MGQIGLPYQAVQVIRSHLAKIRRRWRPKVIFISQASISEDIWSVEKDAQARENSLKVESEIF